MVYHKRSEELNHTVNVAGPWAGRLYGTNTGNIFIQFNQDGRTLSGTARFLDDAFGLVIYDLDGTVGDRVELRLIPKDAQEGTQITEGSAVAYMRPDGTLQGLWQTMAGTAGTFHILPHSEKTMSSDPSELSVPEQLFDHSVRVGSVRLYKNDLADLIEAISRDFLYGRPVVTYRKHDGNVVRFADKFMDDLESLKPLRQLRITVQEPDDHNINKSVVVDLREDSNSEIRVSGLRETWVLGKTENIRKTLDRYQNRIVTGYRKYGLNINSLIFLLMLVAIPEITQWQSRLGFVAGVTTIMLIFYWIHAKVIRNTLIFPRTPEPGLLGRMWPSAVSWIIAASSALFAMWLFSLLRGGAG